LASIISAGTTSGTALNMTGDTSGQLQLATGASATTALTIDTSQNATFAGTLTATGKLTSVSMPTGSVLQVVQGTLTSTVTTSSASFVTTGLTASITPSSASNKILIIVNGAGDISAIGQQIATTIYRGATNLAASTNGFANNYGSSRVIGSMGMSYLDSPATTSSTAYAAYFASAISGSVVFNQASSIGSSVATITLMEIKG